MGEEVRELLEMLGRVERYIRYLDMRASGHTYVAFGLAVAGGAVASFFAPRLCAVAGLPPGPVIGLIWSVVMALALAVSVRSWARTEALALAHRPPEEREQFRRARRKAYTISGLAWVALLSFWGLMGWWLFSTHPGPLWALYMACIGLGNLITYLCPGEKEEEQLYVAISLMACSPLALPAALLAGWAPFAVAVVAVVASYLWAGLRFYGRAEAILAGAEG